MSMIHFVGGEKGGVGKSVFSRVLSQYFLDKALPYIGMDADQSHSTLTRYYQDFTQSISLGQFKSIDKVMELATENDQHILIDLPSQSERFLECWMEENAVLEMCAEMNIPIIYWYIVNDGIDSAQLLEQFLIKYSSKLHCIVVKNQGCGTNFSDIEALTILNTDHPHIQQVFLPALYTETMHKIDKLSFSFWAAINITDKNVQHLNMMERQRTKVWIKKVYAMLDQVFHTISE